tara:strand:- start:69 stop:707 length:639 start_codon:yes stop_codon:yes gene_type:complete
VVLGEGDERRGSGGTVGAPEKLIGVWYRVDMQKILNKNTNRSLNDTGPADYGFILEKIWNNETEELVDVDVKHDFLDYVASANKYWDNECEHLILCDEEAVVWYLNKKCPDVFCEEFMETFFDVEDEIPDYDYRDWKENPKFLLFASYINSRGGIDEWNWYKVFSGMMLEGVEACVFGGEFGEDCENELFSCSNWLRNELKRKPHMDYWRQC